MSSARHVRDPSASHLPSASATYCGNLAIISHQLRTTTAAATCRLLSLSAQQFGWGSPPLRWHDGRSRMVVVLRQRSKCSAPLPLVLKNALTDHGIVDSSTRHHHVVDATAAPTSPPTRRPRMVAKASLARSGDDPDTDHLHMVKAQFVDAAVTRTSPDLPSAAAASAACSASTTAAEPPISSARDRSAAMGLRVFPLPALAACSASRILLNCNGHCAASAARTAT